MRTKTILAALASFTVIGAAANAGDAFTWVGGNIADPTLWTVAANWTPNDSGYPGQSSGDSVTIPDVSDASGNDPVLNVSPANQLTTMTIDASGKLTVGNGSTSYILGVSGTTTLNGELVVTGSSHFDADGAFAINSESTLTIDSSGVFDIGGATTTYNAGTITINGELHLSTSTSKLEFKASVTPGGGGDIIGKHESAQVRVKADKILTIGANLTVQGQMQVVSFGLKISVDGTLDNDGTIIANIADKTLELMSGLRLNGSSGDFKAGVNADAVLKFSQEHTDNCDDITGDFFVDDGATLDFNASINTTGNFTCAGSGNVTGAGSLTYKCGLGGEGTAGSC